MVKKDNKKDVKKTTEKIITDNKPVCILLNENSKKLQEHNSTMIKKDNKKDVKKPFSPSSKKKHIFYCETCDYTTYKKYNLEKHFLTQKHIKLKSSKSSKSSKKVAKVAKSINDKFENNYFENIFSYKNCSGDFYCSKCKFTTKHLHNFKRHLKTKKHNTGVKFMNNRFMCDCGKEYNYQSGLSRHKIKCKFISKESTGNKKPYDESSEIFEMIKEKINFNQTIINNTNHYQNTNINMQIYLNENCKDAMNIQDFVNSLDYTIKSLTDIVTDTITDNVSNIIIKKLENIDFKQRPIHCLDNDNNIVYIKDKDLWECDNNKIILNNTINQVINNKTQHELNSLNQWSSENPQWYLNNNLANNFYQANKKINDINNTVDNSKIIDNIINTVTIDKNLLLKDKIEN